jgi:glycosyltransferase involved in cell wall biosynthesis
MISLAKEVKFSIIIPNYNKEEYVEETLNSIFNQTYKNFEVIVIDDASSDNSLEIIKKYDCIVLHTNRARAGGARNKGLDHATGDYIIFLDSDDYFTDNTVLERLNNLINGEDMIFLNYTKDKFGEVMIIKEEKEDISVKIENTKNLGCPTKCFKKAILEGITFPECKRYEDINFALEAMCKAQKYTFFTNSFFTYRKVPTSNTTTEVTGDAMLDILEELIKMHRLCLKYPKYKINLINRIKRDRL